MLTQFDQLNSEFQKTVNELMSYENKLHCNNILARCNCMINHVDTL